MKKVRSEIYSRVIAADPHAAEFISEGGTVFAHTTSQRPYIGELTRKYSAQESYESPLFKGKAWVSYMLEKDPVQAEVMLCIDAYMDEYQSFGLMMMPGKKDGVTDNEYFSLVEDALSVFLALQYVDDSKKAIALEEWRKTPETEEDEPMIFDEI